MRGNMPTRTAFIVSIGEVLETGPPRSTNRSATTTASSGANKNNNSTNLNSGQSGLDDSDDSSNHSRPQSPASSTHSDAPRPRQFRRMKTRVSNTGGTSSNAVPTANQNGTASVAASVASTADFIPQERNENRLTYTLPYGWKK